MILQQKTQIRSIGFMVSAKGMFKILQRRPSIFTRFTIKK